MQLKLAVSLQKNSLPPAIPFWVLFPIMNSVEETPVDVGRSVCALLYPIMPICATDLEWW